MGVEVTTVVCFPFADLVSIRGLECELGGDHVHLVPGIDRDVEGLIVHLLHEAPTVLVVVHSDALRPARLDAVLSTFAKQRARNHRLCVVEFDADAPADFLRQVEEAVEEMRTRTEAEPICTTYASSSSSQRRSPSVPAPVASARSTPRGAPPGLVVEQSAEFSTEQFELTDTNPGATESGTTYPDLKGSAENVRRGRKDRQTRRARRRAITAVSVGAAVLAIGAALWLQSDAVPEPVVRSAAVSPKAAPKPKAFAPKAPAPAKHAAETTPAPPPTNPPSSAAPQAAAESRRIAAAVDDGKIHALDALLSRTATRSPETFGDAKRRCEKLDVAGLTGWRVPTLDELRSLRRARLLPEGEFWSASNRGRRARHTLSRAVTRPFERATDDAEHAATLCVRGR
jgi:hypothetical protein